MLSLSTLRDIKVIGHRGACGYAPENTMSSFFKALDCGVRWIEFDVVLAACGTPIIFHDETLDRTTNGTGDLGLYTYNQLKDLDAGSWFDPHFKGEHIPTLDEMMHQLMKTPLCFNVEIKPLPEQDHQTVLNTLQVLQPHLKTANHRFLFSSFSISAMRHLRELNQQLNLGLLLHEWLPDWDRECSQLNCVSLHVNHSILTPTRIQQMRSKYALFSYTVNQREYAENLLSLGVDAIFSDYPDRMINN